MSVVIILLLSKIDEPEHYQSSIINKFSDINYEFHGW
jgi:hypothetical protein